MVANDKASTDQRLCSSVALGCAAALQVVVIGKAAVGLGGHCNEFSHTDKRQCEWDSISYMQNEYTSGHRQLLLDCLGVDDQTSRPSQRQTKVTIVHRLLAKGRSMLNMLEIQSALAGTGAAVQIVNMEGVCVCIAHAVWGCCLLVYRVL